MKFYLRIPAAIIVLLVCCTLASSVQAGATGPQIINWVKNNPCVDIDEYTGGKHSFPVITCESYKGAASSIRLLIPEWKSNPEYHMVGEPFYLGIGQHLNAAGIAFPTNTLIWNEKVKINNFQIKMRSVPIQPQPDLDFNGIFAHDPRMDTTMTVVREPGGVSKPEVYSGWDIEDENLRIFYPPGHNKYIDTIMMSLIARKSSYHAKDPATYLGEPAYRLEVTSYYRIDVEVSWSSHQFWVEDIDTVCVSGPTGGGVYNCTLNDGTWGHYTTVDNSDWGVFQAGHNGGWQTEYFFNTKLVRWPDNTNHDHIPILVFQSQPLLQKP